MRHGFLLIDKPTGPTSHDSVATVRRRLHEKSIGHLGTLDPAASGLLVLAVGSKALKVIELFGDLEKEYEAEVMLGAVSSTYDREGVIEKIPNKPGWEVPSQVQVRRMIEERFLGKISQVPPAHSAIKIGGERAYRKARQGKGVNVPARDVTIHKCSILSYEYPILKLKVRCGSGTYIRSLANDLGHVMGCSGYLSALRRTMVGEWSVADAVDAEQVDWVDVKPLKEVMTSFPRVDLTDEEMEDVTHGREIHQQIEVITIGWYQDLPVAILEPSTKKEGMAHARKVL